MPTAKRTSRSATKPPRTVAINCLVDTLGALAQDAMQNNVYYIDNNRLLGSDGEGTDHLATACKPGDIILWTVESMEPEAYAAIDDIVIDSAYVSVEPAYFAGSDVVYWHGVVKKKVAKLEYQVRYLLGTKAEPLTADTGSRLTNAT